MLLVTGGAGFIGSNVVAALNDAGRRDVVVSDMLGSDGKWRNLAKRELAAIIPPDRLMAFLGDQPARQPVEAIFHLGAISSTTEPNADLIVPDRDYFACAEEEIADITSELTVVGGRVVFGAGDQAGGKGGVYALSTDDGSLLFGYDDTYAVLSGPSIAGSNVVVGDAGGNVMAFGP